MTQQEQAQAFIQAYTALANRDGLYRKQKQAYNNLSQQDFDKSYNAVVYGNQSNATPMRADMGLLNSLAYDNSFTSGVTDTAATWLAGGARLLGDLGDSLKDIGSRAGVQPLNGEGSQALKDFANRADEVKRQVRINHDINRGDSTFSNIVYGAGRVAPELLFPAGKITMGTGLAGNALRGAGYGALGGGLTSALDSDQSWEQALGGAAIGAGAGGFLGAVGASLLGKFTGHGWGNAPKAGLLNSTIDDAGNIKVDTNVGATNASDDAIARAMNAQQTQPRWQTTEQMPQQMVGQPHWYPNARTQAQAGMDNVHVNPNANDVQMSVKPPKEQNAIQQISAAEEAQLRKEFVFKDNRPLQRELTSNAIAHALKQHGNPEIESRRGQIAITLDDIREHYPAITQNYDYRAPTNNNTIAYVKQINGHFITIEEVVQNGTMRFKTAWKTKGNFNQQQVFRNAQYVENRSQIGNPRPADITATQAEYSSKTTPETLADQANPTPHPLNNPLENPQHSIKTDTMGAQTARNLAHQAATNGIAGTAGGIANVALEDSDDSLALKFAKGFALGVAGRVAAKHGMNAGAKASKQAFDYAMHKSAQFSTLLRENPQLFTRFLNKQLTDDFAQFGGARSGLHAECFAVAEALAKKGVSAEEILSRTGWFKGLDGEWKIQLDLRGGAAYKLKEGTYNLSQLFKQDSLYAAYPFLRKVRVQIARLPENVQGNFEPTTGIITLNSANNKLDFTKALAHELQHVIQKYEGFAQGSSTKNPNYWTSAGEVEARATFKNGEDNPRQRLANELREGEAIETYQKSGTYQNGLQHSLASEAQRRLEKIDVGKLNAEQKEILSVFKGEKDQATLQGKDINDLYSLESGSRKKGAKKILIKHYGIEKTGGLHDDELLGMMKIVRDGDINAESFSEGKDFIRYAYELVEQGDVRLKLVVDEFNDGKKIFDLYSSRNFIDETSVHSPKLPNRQENNSAKDIKSGLNVQHSQKLENAYLDKDTRKINTEALDRHAMPLPKALNEYEFMAQAKIDSRGIARVETPIGEIDVHMKGAWRHMNGGNSIHENRTSYSGAFYSTLTDPLFVVKQKRTVHRSAHSAPNAQTVQQSGARTGFDESIPQDSYIFFKPYKDSNGSKYLAAFALDIHGNLTNTTFFNPNMSKIRQWIQSHNDDLLYYKYDNDVQHSLQSPLDSLKSAQGRINGLVAFAKYLANPPAHLRGDAQRLRADKAAMRELDMHTRQALTDKANAIDALAYQTGYPEPQYSLKNPRQKQKFAADSVGILQQIRAKSREGMEKIMRNSWVNGALGTRIYGENFADYRF